MSYNNNKVSYNNNKVSYNNNKVRHFQTDLPCEFLAIKGTLCPNLMNLSRGLNMPKTGFN